MRKEYDISKMRSRKNPYVSKLKCQVTGELDTVVFVDFVDQICINRKAGYVRVLLNAVYQEHQRNNNSYPRNDLGKPCDPE